jgi:hypothetical protein
MKKLHILLLLTGIVSLPLSGAAGCLAISSKSFFVGQEEKATYVIYPVTPIQPYELTDLTHQERQAWFPGRPAVVNEQHYQLWQTHVEKVFGNTFQAPTTQDTLNTQEMLRRDCEAFEQLNRFRNPFDDYYVPLSLEGFLAFDDATRRLAIKKDFEKQVKDGSGEQFTQQRERLTAIRVAKIERYRVGLLLEIERRQSCPSLGCDFGSLKYMNGLPYILAHATPHNFEKPKFAEEYHVVPEPLGEDAAGVFFDQHITNKQQVTDIDTERAGMVLNSYLDIFHRSQLPITSLGIVVPVVIAALEPYITAENNLIQLHNIGSIKNSIASRLAETRKTKDMDFFHKLRSIVLSRPKAVSQEQVLKDPQPLPSARSQRLPFIYGFLAGLACAGAAGCTAYFWQSFDSIRIAAGSASAAACMAFAFAHYKLAQNGNSGFWQGMRCGAGVSAVAGAGLCVAHDSPIVQKLLAGTSRNN